MRFGEFYTRLCIHLKANYGWNGPISYLAHDNAVRLELVVTEYNKHSAAHDTDWQAALEDTALKVDRLKVG